jgi:O-antigen/teichoic acid export membrane protein
MIRIDRTRIRLSKLAGAIGKQGSYLLLARSLQSANSVLLSAFLVRRFGLELAGTYAVASFLVPLLTHISSLGLQSSLAREDLKNEERNTVALSLTLLILPLVASVACLYSFFMAQSNVEIPMIFLFALVGYFIGQNTVLNALLLLQSRTHLGLLPPVLTSCGILLAGVLSPTVIQFAAVILVSQAIGHASLFAAMGYMQIGMRKLLQQGKRGLMFLPTDLFWSLAEEAGPMILSGLLPRQDLGLFGLCRQVTRAAEMPSWSLGQLWYVELVKTKLGAATVLMGSARRLAVVVTAAVVGGSAILGWYVYRVPVFWPMSCLLAISIPARYDVNLSDLVLRAAGRIRACTLLAFSRLMVSLVFLPAIGSCFGVWGALSTLAAISIVMDALYKRQVKSALTKSGMISTERMVR